jgi:hypothetical protein
VKWSAVVRLTAHVLLEALAGPCSLRWTLHVSERRMRSGTQMNIRKKHLHSGQLLKDGFHWAIDPSVGAYGVVDSLSPKTSRHLFKNRQWNRQAVETRLPLVHSLRSARPGIVSTTSALRL